MGINCTASKETSKYSQLESDTSNCKRVKQTDQEINPADGRFDTKVLNLAQEHNCCPHTNPEKQLHSTISVRQEPLGELA